MIKEIIEILTKKQLKIAFAESMTGGLISSTLTDCINSSQAFEMTLVCYSNEAKEQLLNIPLDFIEEKGVISKEVSEKMAVSVKEIAKSDIGIAITGNAGPTALENSVVGQVWFTIAFLSEIHHYYYYFEDMDRKKIKQCATKKVFEALHRLLKQKIIGDL